MKKLVLASLIALAASQAAGCIITSGDDDTGENAFVSATWKLRSEKTNTDVPCPPTFDTAALFNQPIDANGNNAGPVIVDLFNCADTAGTSAALPPTTYLTWVEIQNSNGSNTYAKSLSAVVDVTVSDKTFNTQILVDGGYFQLQWQLQGASTNAALTCAQANAAGGVETVGTDVSDPNNSNSDIFDCEDQYGVTAGYTMGTYTVSVAALNSSDASVGTAPALTNKVIQDKNQVTNLGTITIPITGM
ncbi:MAG TPA: hypothetical protein VFV99_21345 [Kofleriaceae bacterium]|nr:hypothetical protein [Kofleriaceae bacterium]